MTKLNITVLAAACSIALSASAFGANMPKADYKMAKDEITATTFRRIWPQSPRGNGLG